MGESVTNPRKYLDHLSAERGIAVPQVPEACVIAHVRSVLDGALEQFPVDVLDIGAQRRSPIHLFRPPRAPPFGMVFGVQGAPMAAAKLEELIALGFRRFWSVGTAGHPVHGTSVLEVGDLVLVDRALVYEGTSPHYVEGVTTTGPDREMFDALYGALRARKLPHAVGAVATTDALYRETPAFLEEVVTRDAVAIDMELSALFTVSRLRGTQIAALLVISDLVSSEGTWTLGLASERLRESEQSLLTVLLDCLEVR
jgi:uridine phosphorylase